MNNWLRQIDRTNALVAIGVWLVALTVYVKTMAPTVTFWDCGEFIAVSYILGVPHPPGTPLFVLIGRLFTFNPFISEPSARINFLSALSSSFTVMFAYLIGVRVLRNWFNDQSKYSRLLTYAGAASGALFLAWGKTQWFNSTEAEVYGLSMLLFLAALWLTLIYFETPESPRSTRLMLAVVYLAFLGIGAHMTTFLVLPVCALFFIMKRETPVRYWFMAAVVIFFELYLIYALSSRPNEIPYYVPVLVVFILYLLYVFSQQKTPKELLYVALGFLVSIAPIFGLIMQVVRTGEVAHKSGGVLNIVGIIGLVATLLAGLWALISYNRTRSGGRKTSDPSLLVSALFVLAAAVMVLLPVIQVRGYGAFLFLSVVLIGLLGVLLWNYIRWPHFIAITGAALVMIGIRQFAWGLVAAAAALAVMGLLAKFPGWKSGLMILAVAVLGFSVHLFIPIRAAQQPYINENGVYEKNDLGKTVNQTIGFLERKQYGSESMTERMFKRRAEWANQFGTYRRMGYWGFFQQQYGINNKQFFIVLMLGIFGLWEAVRRRPQVGLALTLLIVMSSIGLVLYMNFADGTRQTVSGADYIEVRDRDYFFTPAFVFFGLAIGLGIAAFIQFVRESTARLAASPRMAILAVLPVLFLLPGFALARNYFECNRSNNWIAHDYANSLLQSADKNAVLFTYGDNDTFPLWCLQEAYGIRKDVRNVNLSLANTKWYMKQVHNTMGLRLGWTDEEIDNLHPYRLPDGRVFQMSDILTDGIIKHNRSRVPINFSSTVPADGRKYEGKPLDDYLSLVSLAWRLRETGGGMQVSVEEALAFFYDPVRFTYRGLKDPHIFKDDNETRLVSNYSNAILMTADTLRQAKRYDEAAKLLELAVKNLPDDQDVLNMLASVYTASGKFDRMRALLESPDVADKPLANTILGRELYKAGYKEQAKAMLQAVFDNDPTYRPAFEELSRLYNQERDYQGLHKTLTTWVRANPTDTQVINIIAEMDRRAAAGELNDSGR